MALIKDGQIGGSMAEYIKRETVVEKLNKLCDSVCPYPNKAHYAMCGSCLLSDALIVVEDDVPEVDVVECKTGKWERHYSRPNVYADLYWHCSVCGYENENQYANTYHHFCPNCGAKME